MMELNNGRGLWTCASCGGREGWEAGRREGWGAEIIFVATAQPRRTTQRQHTGDTTDSTWPTKPGFSPSNPFHFFSRQTQRVEVAAYIAMAAQAPTLFLLLAAILAAVADNAPQSSPVGPQVTPSLGETRPPQVTGRGKSSNSILSADICLLYVVLRMQTCCSGVCRTYNLRCEHARV